MSELATDRLGAQIYDLAIRYADIAADRFGAAPVEEPASLGALVIPNCDGHASLLRDSSVAADGSYRTTLG